MEVFCIMKNLKSLRLKNNLTQAALAKELNVTQNAVYQWENGKREPSSEMVEKIANYFKVSPNYLMGWEQKKGIDSTIANNIVKYRKLYKISQKQLADYLGISTNVLRKNEKGEIDFSQAVVLEDVARMIFTEIKNATPIEKILKEIVKEYNVENIQAEKDLNDFIQQLKDEEIIYDR